MFCWHFDQSLLWTDLGPGDACRRQTVPFTDAVCCNRLTSVRDIQPLIIKCP